VGEAACAVLALCAVTVIAVPAETFITLHSFDGTDGADPYAGLVQATNGDLYGTTYYGGVNSCVVGGTDLGCGTVFKITPSGTLTTLYSFCSQSACADGEYPNGLMQAANGDLYGTTGAGGTRSAASGRSSKSLRGGTLTTVHIFEGDFAGIGPYGLTQAASGELFGTTGSGGASGAGTIFSMTPGGTLTTLYSFCTELDCADGQSPSGLVRATNGDLYGTTVGGGSVSSNCLQGSFGCGTVFKITPGGTFTTLYSFCSQPSCPDGQAPEAVLVQATDGDLYGTTLVGGIPGYDGTVFKITPGGRLTTLHSFNGADGSALYTGLVQDTNGVLYGTTSWGGANGYGTIFRLSVGLGPFVETRPASGEAGAFVEILGSDLTGATSVSFNGTAATFTVVSRSLITATVPAGASTGKVEVVTPGATLSSNVAFRIP
jgi:uncharacterized repeat protein (TIGR03803 family)